ncbi:hypothetical protein [Fibrobacter sp. UWEL]|uniref:choice-of-anchor I domain-containing protein n=1 Tax=Fibrobacter sp. UWEL TaxID=1896209 RepID=UPI00091AD67C|nr:hypothetical protein [Fibrobacter sp. UWEL]SHK31324.1 hypothetical protein SAMN05720468_10178 [Fibrobacter sp. UWEL]
MNRLLTCAVAFAVSVAVPSFAKKNKDVSEGPFQLGHSLEMVSRTELNAAEIATYVPEQKRLYTVGDEKIMEVVDLSNPASPKIVESFGLDGVATSVTSYGDLLAVSLLNEPAWEKGFVELLQVKGETIQKLHTVPVCYHPDMLTFSPDGSKIVVACEGEPSEDGKENPEGGIAILDMTLMAMGTAPAVIILPFEDKDVEPEYVTISHDSKVAWVSLQENNALARVNLETKTIEKVFDLGYVDHSKKGFALDAEKDGKIRIENAFIRSLRQPDGVKYFEVNGKHYVATANEGAEVKNFNPKTICGNEEKCRVKFGSRSVSIFDGDDGKLVWDSGEQLEQTFAKVAPEYFNWNSKKGKAKVDARSDDMGSEPENIVIGKVGDKLLAFLGMERMSGVAVFDFTQAGSAAPKLLDYYMDPKDRGPEGMLFIDADKNTTGETLLIVCYEYSKTLVVYKVK